MALNSKLFKGDPKLEACAVNNPAHITTGATGRHVAKIQTALIRLDEAIIDTAELKAQKYGASTADAVLKYKQARGIINRTYQTQADNIVGIMTIQNMDKELVDLDKNGNFLVTVQTFKCSISES
jgi:peptidoglycan hydrolase-like protein with peptidoglycan-binding domain